MRKSSGDISGRYNACDLHVHSTFSTQDGLGDPKSIVKRAKELGWGAVALTEHGWMGSAPFLYKEARKQKIKPVLGCELYVVPPEAYGQRKPEFRTASHHLTVLALNVEGYHNLVRWTSLAMQPDNYYYRSRISLEAMVDSALHPLKNNVILSGCMGGELCQCLVSDSPTAMVEAETYVEMLKSQFPNFYIELQSHQHDKFMGGGFTRYEEMVAQQTTTLARLIALAEVTDTPTILTNDSHFQSSKQRQAHIAMMSRRKWHKGDEDKHQSDSGEMSGFLKDYIYFTNYMQPMEVIADAALPAGVREKAIQSIHDIVDEVDIRLEPIDNFKYSLPFSGHDDPIAEIRRLCKVRLAELVKKHGKDTMTKRFEREIGAMGDFAHYLLLMAKILNGAKDQGILTSLRGSAANSIVCYCLGIHDIDSIDYMLAFERFVNPARKKFPDIDIDIESDRRDDFMQIVYGIMDATGEGKENVRLMCTYSTLANRATFRLVAGALGMSEEKQDEVAKLLPQMIDSGLLGEDDDLFEALKEDYPELYELSSEVFDSITKISQHACGFLFGTRERPLADWVPEFHIASSGQNVTQYNAAGSELFGLIKMDFLKLETLAVMKKVMQQVGMGDAMLSDIPLDDAATYKMLREGKTAGVHSMQGKTQRRGCMETAVDNIHDVVAVQALYRPSGTRTGFTDKFCARRRGDEAVSYPHEIVEQILGITYGLPIYQEQVLEIGYAIGMSDLEVEQILGAIKVAKGVGRGAAEAFAALKPMFMRYCTKLMQEEDADNIWALFDAFQGYGFNRGHATAYAILAVRSAYLKCHYPAEFFSALLDVFPERQDYIASVRAEGFVFEAPDVNRSGSGFMRGEKKNGIRIGLTKIDGIGVTAAREIEKKQPFTSVDDMKERCSSTAVNAGTVKRLGPIGALKGLGVRPTATDGEMLRLLGLLLDTPKAFDKIDEVVLPERPRSSWKFKGLSNDVYPTAGKAFVSKLFWIPDEDYTSDAFGKPKKLIDFKATPWAQAKTNLLLAVDENGIPFEIHVNEKKEVESAMVKLIADKCQGKVICLDGRIVLPFMKEHPSGFSLWGITGAELGVPQMWEEDDNVGAKFTKLAALKSRGR